MKPNLCLIGGTGLMQSDLFKDFKPVKVKNKYGRAIIFRQGDIFFIQRHYGNLPPHQINFRAYFQALANLNVKKIISFNSAGALKKSLKINSLMVPHDFICLNAGPTFFDERIVHTTPLISENLREFLIKICRQAKAPVYGQGVYLQTAGSRFETAAEVKMFSRFADIVGMTLASEVILASEMGLEIASVCSIDNYSNGLTGHLDYRAGAKNSGKTVEEIVKKLFN